MSTNNQILTFNLAAAGIIGGLSRLRLNKKTRGGVDYAALRPSHRVKGTNPMLKVEKVEGTDTFQAELTAELIAMVEGVPALKNQATYQMVDIGYGWWTLRDFDQATAKGDEPLVTVTKATKTKAKTVPVTDAAPATAAEAIVEATADAALEVAGEEPAAAPTESGAEALAAASTAEHESAVRSMESVAQMRDITPIAPDSTVTVETANTADLTAMPAPSATPEIAATAQAETAAPAEAVQAVVAGDDETAKFGEALKAGLTGGLTAADLGIEPVNTEKTEDENITPDAGAAANSAVRDEKGDDDIVTHVITA